MSHQNPTAESRAEVADYVREPGRVEHVAASDAVDLRRPEVTFWIHQRLVPGKLFAVVLSNHDADLDHAIVCACKEPCCLDVDNGELQRGKVEFTR